MNLESVNDILIGEPVYRVKQIQKALYKDLIDDWSQATTLPLSLREKMNSQCPLSINAELFESSDKKTVKALITLKDGIKIETVLMRHNDKRNTVCVSSQAGCAMACVFCATGKMGFKRNLTQYEIAQQVMLFGRYLKKTGEKVTNVVFMGMGEPFLNYENVLAAIKFLNDPEGFGLGGRNFSISTSGIIEGIRKLSQEKMEINLAISLHAPNQELRSKIMPVNRKYPIGKVMDAASEYVKARKRRVMFEYIMIDGFNDSLKDAEELAKLMDKPLYFVNLIPCNPTPGFSPSPAERVKKFKEFLLKKRVDVTQRYGFGRDIEAACGQLAAKEENNSNNDF
ncbi:MAG: 23S rRNA (adenine(2503)-C(2))-methyltransferase RlmN [Candidatus Paceibacterota bacterium]|jgi:23S rRNA (adenine2503-C2)-methyltransferase